MESSGKTRNAQQLGVVWLVWLTILGIFLAHCVIKSSKKYFWIDEVLTEVVVRDSTFSQATDSLRDTINAMPPTYFALLWSWVQCFGDSPISLRLFSASGIVAACLFSSAMLRLAWDWRIAALATWVSFASSKTVLYFNVEARCYALYLAFFCAASFWFVKSWGDTRRNPISLGLMGFATHSLLVTTHYIGVFYSAGLILAGMAGFWIHRRRGCLHYLKGAIPGAATILFCLPFYLDQRTLGGSNSWIGRPTISELVGLYQYQIGFHVFVIIGFTVFVFGGGGRWKSLGKEEESFRNPEELLTKSEYRRAILAVVLVAVSVPMFVWMESLMGMKLFVGRYFFPSFLMWPCIAGFIIAEFRIHLLRSNIPGSLFPPRLLLSRNTPLLGAAALAALPIFVLLQDANRVDPANAYMEERLQVLKQNNLPFASSNLHDITALRHYSDHQRGEWVTLPTDDLYGVRRAERTVARSLERRYWPYFVQSPDRLLEGRSSVIVAKDEWEAWTINGFVKRDEFVEESLDAGLAIIRKLP